MKEIDFSLEYYFSLSISKFRAWLSNHMVCKIGLTELLSSFICSFFFFVRGLNPTCLMVVVG
jgi:hypothetical protein